MRAGNRVSTPVSARATARASTRAAMDERLVQGIALFNDGEFFRCHEVLEETWRLERGPRRRFLQAVIHVAVGFYHSQRGNPAGAVAQLRKGLELSLIHI